MRKTLPKQLLAFLAAAILFSGFYTTYLVTNQTYDDDKDIAFVFQQIQEGYSISNGSGSYHPGKGLKLVIASISFKNFSGEKKKIDFRNFYLLDPNSHIKYKVELVTLVSAINIFSGLDSTIGTGKRGNEDRKLIFSFPENEKPEMFMVNDKVYDIHYTDVKK